MSRSFVSKNRVAFEEIPFPIMTTWNAADRIDSNQQNYMGRPNTWGQRSANVILQQADLIMAVGTRLGLQQTGFNRQGFGPLADIVHVDVDANELNRANLKTKFKYQCDAHYFLAQFLAFDKTNLYEDWIDFSKSVREILPPSESSNVVQGDFWNPYDFVLQLSQILVSSDSIIPSSSGAAETVTMQALQQVDGNTVIKNIS